MLAPMSVLSSKMRVSGWTWGELVCGVGARHKQKEQGRCTSSVYILKSRGAVITRDHEPPAEALGSDRGTEPLPIPPALCLCQVLCLN